MLIRKLRPLLSTDILSPLWFRLFIKSQVLLAGSWEQGMTNQWNTHTYLLVIRKRVSMTLEMNFRSSLLALNNSIISLRKSRLPGLTQRPQRLHMQTSQIQMPPQANETAKRDCDQFTILHAGHNIHNNFGRSDKAWDSKHLQLDLLVGSSSRGSIILQPWQSNSFVSSNQALMTGSAYVFNMVSSTRTARYDFNSGAMRWCLQNSLLSISDPGRSHWKRNSHKVNICFSHNASFSQLIAMDSAQERRLVIWPDMTDVIDGESEQSRL